ncbi:MAG: metal-dependent hydrolase [Nitrospira sp.]|nr:metal-dependent hydrolase [Nitrospira sp.]
MMGRTHCLVPAAMAAWLFGPDPTFLLISAGTGLLPDIDEPQSTIGYRLFLLAKGFKGLVGHRTYSHSLVGIVTAASWPSSLICRGCGSKRA